MLILASVLAFTLVGARHVWVPDIGGALLRSVIAILETRFQGSAVGFWSSPTFGHPQLCDFPTSQADVN